MPIGNKEGVHWYDRYDGDILHDLVPQSGLRVQWGLIRSPILLRNCDQHKIVDGPTTYNRNLKFVGLLGGQSFFGRRPKKAKTAIDRI